ncbi:MAG: hypothetical protein ACJAXS_003044 [Colwellia sp.]
MIFVPEKLPLYTEELPHEGLNSANTATSISFAQHKANALFAPRRKFSVTILPLSSTTAITPESTSYPSPPFISAGALGMLIPELTSGQMEITLPSSIHSSRIMLEVNKD